MRANKRQRTVGRSNKRRSFIVNPAFQWKYAFTLGIGVFLTTSILSCVLYATLYEQARQRFVQPVSTNLDAGMNILFFALLFSVITAGTVITLSVITSHRVCGPLFVLEGYFKQIVSGRIPKPRPLRKKDEFKQVLATFVQATERMRSDQHKQCKTYNSLLNLIQRADTSDEQSCRKALGAIEKEVTSLRNEIADLLDIERKPIPSEDVPDPALNENPQHSHAGA